MNDMAQAPYHDDSIMEAVDDYQCDEDRHDPEREWKCCFPGECLMPGPHMRSECHTVEMAEAFEVAAEAVSGDDEPTDGELIATALAMYANWIQTKDPSTVGI